MSSVHPLCRRWFLSSKRSTSVFAAALAFLVLGWSLRQQPAGFGDIAQETVLASKWSELGWQVESRYGCSGQRQWCPWWRFRRWQPVGTSKGDDSYLNCCYRSQELLSCSCFTDRRPRGPLYGTLVVSTNRREQHKRTKV